MIDREEAEQRVDAALMEMEQLIRADERERCAKVAESIHGMGRVVDVVAAKIRALPAAPAEVTTKGRGGAMAGTRLSIEWREDEDGKADGWQVRVPATAEEPEAVIRLTKWDLKFTTAEGEGLRFQSPLKRK